MSKSQLEAHTFGMGQLITQRKVFNVPRHQRNFAWTIEEAEQYLQDIGDALTRNATDYFVGLIVLQGPIENTWHILDGQQRLATTVMIYSAIRHWLFNHGLEQDARQIENEYIGVRQLGGKYSPRLQLNTDNFATFDKFIVSLETTETLKKELSSTPKRTSNSNLLEVALFCREWIDAYAVKHNTSSYQGNALFDLAVYLETRVTVVCVDVPDQVDAYVLFETLNDRGADLSAPDLVRNYIFSQIGEDDDGAWRVAWRKMIQNIEGRNADDFLKVFWTSKFGVIQKLDLFKRLRETYPNEEAVKHLIYSLADASEKFEAIDDSEHDLWLPYGLICRQRIRDLKTLGNRQCRSLILGALTSFCEQEIPPFLWLLIVVIVRYQVIGRGRTGVMEKVFSQLAQEIHSGRIKTAADSFEKLGPLLSDDEVFRTAFTVHQENKPSRVQYFLLELEAVCRTSRGSFSWEDYVGLRAIASTAYPAFIKSEQNVQTDEGRAIIHSIGNRILLEDATIHNASLHDENHQSSSRFLLTEEIGSEVDWPLNRIVMRAQFLADLATKAWLFNNPLQNPPSVTQ